MKERQTFRNHNGAVYLPIQRRITSSVPNKFDVYVRGKQPSFVVKWRVNITCRKMSPNALMAHRVSELREFDRIGSLRDTDTPNVI